MMYCFDTSIVVAIIRGDSDLKQRISKIPVEEASFTWITLCELYRGANLSNKIHEGLEDIEKVLFIFTILDFTQEACKLYGEEYAYLERIGKRTQEADLMIGAVAKAHGATLATRNKKHFEHIRGLKVEEW